MATNLASHAGRASYELLHLRGNTFGILVPVAAIAEQDEQPVALVYQGGTAHRARSSGGI